MTQSGPGEADRAAELLRTARAEHDEQALERSIELLRELMTVPETAGSAATNLSVALRTRYLWTGDRDSLEESVDCARRAVWLADPPASVARLRNLAAALHAWHTVADDPRVLAEAVRAAEAAVEASGYAPSTLGDLAGILLDLYTETNEPTALRRALDAARTAAAAGGGVVALNNLTLALRALATDNPELLGDALEAGHAAVRAAPEDATAAGNLALTLYDRYQQYGDPADLDEAIYIGRRYASGSDPGLAGRLGNLLLALTARYARTGAQSDVEEALAVGRHGLDLLAPEDPRRLPLLANQAQAWLERLERTGDRTALDAALAMYRQAIELSRDGHPYQAIARAGLSTALHRWYELTGDEYAMTEALDLARQALKRLPVGGEDHLAISSHLGLLLIERFETTGEPALLDEAVELAERAAAAPGPQRPTMLSNLALVLQSRAEATGERDAADQAVGAARTAVDLVGDNPRRTGFLANLAGAYWRRYTLTNERAALDEAVRVARESAGSLPGHHPDLGRFLSNLSGLLVRAAEETGDARALREAVDLARRAVDVTAPGHPDRAARLNNLGLALRALGEHTGQIETLDAAVRAGRESVETTPEGHGTGAGRRANLGRTLEARDRLRPTYDDRAEAVRLLRSAAAEPAAPIRVRVHGAVRAARIAAADRDWSAATDDFETAVALLPRLAHRGGRRRDREHLLAAFGTVASDAAACALQTGDPRRALALLERGTGILLAQALAIRDQHGPLRERHPHLAKDMDAVADALAREEAIEDGDRSPRNATTAAIRRRRLDRRWTELVEKIRLLDGFEDFQAPPRIPALLAAARHGPIVIVNVSEIRSDALVVESDAVHCVELPTLRSDEVRTRVTELINADQSEYDRTVTGILTWLRHTVVDRLLPSLPPCERLWWMPIGPAGLLPWHAVEGVSGRYVSSYTPTLGALQQARNRPSYPRPAGLQVVAVTDAGGDVSLPAVGREIGALRSLLGDRLTVLSASGNAELLGMLDRYPWAHLACHAYSDPMDPAASHLAIGRGRLGLREISALRLRDAQVAILSACSTSRAPTHLSTEAVHITGAFQLAGFRQVVGTLWPVSDTATARLIRDLYTLVTRTGVPDTASVPQALAAATEVLRRRHPTRPSMWAAFIHVGI